MIAFITIISSDRFVADLLNSYARITLTIGIVGFLLSYLFSIVNLINVRLIYAMGWFLSNGVNRENIHTLRRFNSYISNKFVPLLRFGIGYFWSVYVNTIAFIFAAILKFPLADMDAKKAGYMDFAPHTWLTPMLIAYVWLIIGLITFLDSRYLLPWWIVPMDIAAIGLLIGLVKGIRFRLNKGKVEERNQPTEEAEAQS
jgi:hypothetical protein